MKRKIPYGIMNWAEVVRECYFVDSTAYIRALEDVKTPVFLRPKRFGKSLWCSMLGYYYDVNCKDRFDELFGRTEIGRDPTPLANSFLVLKFDFSTVQVGTVREIERDFTDHVRTRVSEFAKRYEKLADWSAALAKPTAAGIVDAVRSIAGRNGLPPLYVIVDEYDNFTNELVVSRRDVEYDAICGHDGDGPGRESFFKAFFKSFKAGLADGTVGRTYFTGVLPITLDDLSSGFNVGTVVNLNPDLLGMVGFTQAQVDRYVDEIYADRGFDRSNYRDVLADLKAFYDGYRFLPGAEPLYNATICNWYLFNLVSNRGVQPDLVIDANVRMDVVWIRRLAGGTANALARVQAYVERGEGEAASRSGLAAKFGRIKFDFEAAFPYYLYYLGYLTFKDPFTLAIPNLAVRQLLTEVIQD